MSNNHREVRSMAERALEHYRLPDEYPLPDVLSTDSEFCELALACRRSRLAQGAAEFESDKERLAGRAERLLLDAVRERAREVLLADAAEDIPEETLKRLRVEEVSGDE